MKTCKKCDEKLNKSSKLAKYCDDCLASIDLEKERAMDQKQRRSRKRD